MAMRIMIVEDEENIREGLASLLDWEAEGFETPILFGGAIEALQYMSTENVDVVMTDIYMPVLSGLEFIKMLQEDNKLCDIIILTGHERFEFAQEAVELGVKRYLLKPVSPEKLRQVLSEIRNDIAERIKLMDWIAIAEKQLAENLPVMKNQFWNDLLSDRFQSMTELTQCAAKAFIKLPQKEVTCFAIRYIKKDSSLTEEVALRRIVNEIIGESAVYLMPYDGAELVILEGRLYQFKLEILRESILQNLGLEVCFGVSMMSGKILDISRLAKESVEAARSIREPQDMYYLYYADITRNRKHDAGYPYICEKQILDMLRFHDAIVEENLIAFFQRVLPPEYTVAESKIMLLQLLVAMNRTANDMGVEVLKEFKVTGGCIKDFECIEQAFQNLAKIILLQKKNSTKQYAKFMAQQVVGIVEQEFSSPDLTVGSLAERLGMTANYLSRIFRSMTGETCIEYITKVRMEAAKKMLEHTDKKSYLIAQEIGYNNANYFSAMFKKYTGMSPKEFRERSKM